MAAEFTIPDEEWDAPLEEGDQFQLPASPAWANLNAASQGDPDTYAKDLELSKRTGVPINAVKENRDQIKKSDATALISEEEWNKPLTESDNPGVAKYLEDPEAAQVSFDDISILTGLENEARRSWYEVDSRITQGLGDSMMIGMGKTADEAAILMLNDMKRKGFQSWKDIAFGTIPGILQKTRDSIWMAMEGEEATDAWNAELDRKIEKYKQNLEFAESEIGRLTPQNLSVMEEGVRSGIQMGADMAPGLAISVATRGKLNPTLHYLTGKTYLSSYGSAIIAGKDNDTAMQYATIDAALEWATEKLPTQRLEKLFGEAAGGSGIKSSIKKWLLQEGATEQLATATQTINAYAHDLDEELAAAKGWEEVMEIQGRRQAVTLIGTIVGGGGMSGTIKTIDYMANRQQRAMGKIIQKMNKRRGAEFEQERLDSMIYLAQASKTNERASDMFEDFLNNAAPDQQVFMSAEAVDLLNDPPAYILEQMDGSGGDVSIPLGTFLKDFAKNDAVLEQIRPFIKTSENLHTKKELEDDNDSEYIKTLLAKAAEATETKTAADEIYDRVTAQLIATGRQSAATSRQSAEIITAQVTTQYEYLKSIGYKKEDGTDVTLEELFSDFGLEIVGPEVDVATSDFMTQEAEEDVPLLAKGISLLPTADQATIQAAAFQSPGGDVGANKQLMDFFAKQAGYKNAGEYNAALRRQDQEFDAMLQDPAQLMLLATSPTMAAEMNTGPAYKTIALAISNNRGLRILRDKAQVKQIEDDLSVLTEAELVEAIADEFAPGHAGLSLVPKDDRLVRAQKQGYDTSEVLYHGTGGGRDFDEFTIGRAGLIYLTPDQDYAGEYGQTEGYYIRPGKQFDMVNNPEHRQMAIDMFNERGGWQMAVENNGVELEEGRQGYMFDETTDMQWEILDEPETDILSDIRAMGFETFRFYERSGVQAVAVFDPSRIRSVDAEFNPEESSSPRVLAQQDFGNIAITESVVDEAGNVYTLRESAQAKWDEQQARLKVIEQLRGCMS